MRCILSTATLACAMLLSGVAAAACGEAHLIASKGLVRNDDSCLMYCKSEAPNLSTKADAVFWALGAGDPRVGEGIDSGAFKGRNFVFGKQPLNYGDGTFYNYERRFQTNWGATYLIDGCIKDLGPDQCTCLLLTDENAGRGYFAMLTAQRTNANDFWFADEPRLARIPALEVVSNSTADGRLRVDVRMAAPARGSVPGPNGGCACGPLGFTVMGQRSRRTDPPPASRRVGVWDAVGREVAPFGETATVTLDCPAPGEVVYLAGRLRFEDAFDAPLVGAQSDPLSCR